MKENETMSIVLAVMILTAVTVAVAIFFIFPMFVSKGGYSDDTRVQIERLRSQEEQFSALIAQNQMLMERATKTIVTPGSGAGDMRDMLTLIAPLIQHQNNGPWWIAWGLVVLAVGVASGAVVWIILRRPEGHGHGCHGPVPVDVRLTLDRGERPTESRELTVRPGAEVVRNGGDGWKL